MASYNFIRCCHGDTSIWHFAVHASRSHVEDPKETHRAKRLCTSLTVSHPTINACCNQSAEDTSRVIIPAILRLHWLGIQYDSPNPTMDGVLASVFTQIQLSFAIFATTSPILRTFMKALNTQYGGPNHIQTAVSGGAENAGKTPGESISMSSPLSSTSPTERGSTSKWAMPQTIWDNIQYSVQVTTSDKESKSLHSNVSRQRSISKNTSWAVDHTLPEATSTGKAP